jgi:plasmid stabilization system protein ParE
LTRIVWSRQAQRELEELLTYYAQFGPDLPDRLIERVAHATATLLHHPRLGPVVPDSTARRWPASGTPFLLFYRPTRDGIRVLKIRHARSDWQGSDN